MFRPIFIDPFDSIFMEESPVLFSINGVPSMRKHAICPVAQGPSCCQQLARPIEIEKNLIAQKTNGPFSFSFSCGQFKPEDLKVSLNDRVVSIEGSHSSSDSSFSSSFKRTFLLPKSIDLNSVYCMFNEEGVLEIGGKPRESHRQIEITVVPKETDTVEEDKEKDEGIVEDTPILESIGPDTESDKME